MNRIHRAKYRNTGKRGIAFALLLLLVCTLFPNVQARAESLSVRVSASTVKIGETVTVSVTVPAGVSATVNVTYPGNLFSFQSASETANSNGGTVSMTLGGYGGTDTATTGTMTFKAKAAGKATFSASAPVAGNQEGDQVSVGGASATVTVKNEAGGGSSGGNSGENSGGNSGEDDPDLGEDDDDDDGSGDDDDDGGPKSADNSLASLTLSAGKLSPAFRYNIVSYTATVDYSVTSVVVSAKASNAKAKIESVKGGESLKVGDNRIQIIVKAENGVTATYTVTVTRKAQGEAEQPQEDGLEEDDPEEEPDVSGDPSGQSVLVNGKDMYPAMLPEGCEEEGFEQTEVTLCGETYSALTDTFAGGSLSLVYLAEEDGGNGGLRLLLSGGTQEAYDYVRLKAERGFIIVLPEGDGNVPAAYSAMPTSLQIVDYGTVDAWFEESGEKETFPLVYAVSQRGARGWYMLDVDTLSYVRYSNPAAVPAVAEPETETEEAVKPAVKTDTEEIEKLKKQNRLTIGIAAIVLLIMLIVMILMIVVRRGGDIYEEEEEDLYGEPEERKEPVRRRPQREKKAAVSEEPADMDRPAKSAGKEEKAISRAVFEEPAKPAKRYDKSIFDSYYLNDVFRDDEEEEEEEEEAADGEKAGGSGGGSPDDDALFAAAEAGLSESMAKLDDIADPAPMQTVKTHRDKDDDDLEFIDL